MVGNENQRSGGMVEEGREAGGGDCVLREWMLDSQVQERKGDS